MPWEKRHLSVVMTFHQYWPMTSFTMLSCISHREFTAATMALCKIGAAESQLISAQDCCLKCACWDRGRDTKWPSSQEKRPLSHPSNCFPLPSLPPHLHRKDMRSMDLTTGAAAAAAAAASSYIPAVTILGFLCSNMGGAGTSRRKTKHNLLHSRCHFLCQRKADLTLMVHVPVKGTCEVSERAAAAVWTPPSLRQTPAVFGAPTPSWQSHLDMRRGRNNRGSVYLNTGRFSEPATCECAAVGRPESGWGGADSGGTWPQKAATVPDPD